MKIPTVPAVGIMCKCNSSCNFILLGTSHNDNIVLLCASHANSTSTDSVAITQRNFLFVLLYYLTSFLFGFLLFSSAVHIIVFWIPIISLVVERL